MSKRKKLIIALLIISIIVVMVIFSLRKGKGTEIPVETARATRGTITQIVSGTGRIQPEVEVKISANVSAKIMNMPVIEGQFVQKGQLLVELDRTRYEAILNQARSTLKSSKANYKKSKSDFNRMQDLHAKKLISETELENADAILEQAESQVEQAEAALSQAMDDLAKTTILSPMGGTVTQLRKEIGEIALGAQFQEDVIMTIADLSRMEVLAEVDENDVVLIDIGDSVKIEVDALSDTLLDGLVSEIAHTATMRGLGTQEEVINFEVKIGISERMEKLRPGMSATVDIQTETHRNALKIPIQCVTMKLPSEFKDTGEEGSSSEENSSESDSATDAAESGTQIKKEEGVEVVFNVVSDSAFIVPVKTGISDDTHIEILEGLDENDVVVSGSYRAITRLLKHKCKVINKEASKAEAEKDTE
ncbi:efflux RND transporter periplasmic adaptor subunit [candidate division KSB1 bacterium]|nr:efflux RND transporter periplasmic adaptor subunit [candidate division KSB1 bacterium]